MWELGGAQSADIGEHILGQQRDVVGGHGRVRQPRGQPDEVGLDAIGADDFEQ
ncbi:hypothetical protein JR782_004633 [Salmonella enterica subsp. enterica serovar Eastbourne]|nr:hypothetical protein [Salmonella enterica subsp. enterica serovar Eastbourne]EHC5910042.1 hypothetical protein [Salmonella enterica subsp. enterica serovar Eastbourne]